MNTLKHATREKFLKKYHFSTTGSIMQPYFPGTLSSTCKQCGFEFKTIRKHLQFSPKCRDKYDSENNPEKCSPEYNPEYILSGPCRSCGKVFKRIKTHLSRAPKCIAAYDSTELEEARKNVKRMYNRIYYEANTNKIQEEERQRYQDKREYILNRIKEYKYQNKDRLKAVRKWKLNNQE